MFNRLKNVRLETGFSQDSLGRVETLTGLFDLTISENGKISSIESASGQAEDGALDINGLLAIPQITDGHVHIDKTFLGTDRFHACIPVNNIQERLELEAKDLMKMRDSVYTRSLNAAKSLVQHGTSKLRQHVNVDPFCLLKNLEGATKALKELKGVSFETVAFPQHGLIRKQCAPLLRDALKNGADFLGGIDPGGLDQELETSLRLTFDIATEAEKRIDIHLHDRGTLGLYTMEHLCELTQEYNMMGNVTISHAFALIDMTPAELDKITDKFLELHIDITSTYPFDRRIPVDYLVQKGIPVRFGCDGIYDSWGPFGNGDVLEKVKHFCMINNKNDEISLAQALGLATAGITALDTEGNIQWPKPLDDADFVFLDASCSAEVVARLPERKMVMVGGEIIWEKDERETKQNEEAS